MVSPSETERVVEALAHLSPHEPIFPEPGDLRGNFYRIIDGVFKFVIAKKREEGKLNKLTKVAIERETWEIERTVHWRDTEDIRRNIQAHMTDTDGQGVLTVYGHAWKDYSGEVDASNTEADEMVSDDVDTLARRDVDTGVRKGGGIRKFNFSSVTTPLGKVTLGSLIEAVGNMFEEISVWTEVNLTTIVETPPLPPGWENVPLEEF